MTGNLQVQRPLPLSPTPLPRRGEGGNQPITINSLQRRRFISELLIASLLFPKLAWASVKIKSARLWPAKEYTRLIVESGSPINHQLITLNNPARLVLDLEDIEGEKELTQLVGRVNTQDPHLLAIRVARHRPGVWRVVLDLKAEVSPQLFAVRPAGEYEHRLVLELYPSEPYDPLQALLEMIGDHSAEPDKGKIRGKKRPLIIMLDPGHGGEDPGAIGKRGTYEKDIVLAIARKLKARIDKEPNMRALMTRDDDYFVPLAQRVHKARRVQADLFLSIHADAFHKSDVRGSSVFALSERGATSTAARWLAQKENNADLIGGVNLNAGDPLLAKTLLDLTQTATINDSLKFGKTVLSELSEVNALHKRQVEQAGFAVLKAPDIPSILVETAFISNPEEEQRLRSETHQSKLAGALLEGIKAYFAKNPALAEAPGRHAPRSV